MNPLPADAAAELDERRLQVIAEMAGGLRWQIALTAAIVAAIAWRGWPAALLAGWFAAVLATREWRAVALRRMASDRARPVGERLAATVRWNLALGAVNGSAALFMLRLDVTLDAVLTMILVSWGAGAVSTSSTLLRAFVAYAAWLFVPTAAMWAATGTPLGAGVATLVLMFFGVQLRFARRNLETFEESFRIRLENEALARSLAAERAELARARDAAVQANEAKSRFLAAASHDLRQPLQALALNADELRRRALPGDAGEVAGDIALGVEQLRTMLDGLLDVSKLDAGVVVAQRRQVDVSTLLGAVATGFRRAATARGLALRIDCPPGLLVHSDPELLRRLLANLLDNAVKFTREGEIAVEVRAEGEHVRFCVRDTGPGIAPEHQPLVFEDLVRLPRPEGDAPAPGHGLGLGIVRRIAALLGTEVVLESAPGAGSRFRWQLARAGAAAEPARVEHEAPRSAGWRVLVVDDEPMVRGAYVKALAGLGCRPLAAGSIDEALQQLAGAPVDAVVLDQRLRGDERGLDAVGRLRGHAPGLAVVMVSADTGPALAAAAAGAGVTLLRKPVDTRTLQHALAAQLAAPGPAPSGGSDDER